jgi:hypothetical protein
MSLRHWVRKHDPIKADTHPHVTSDVILEIERVVLAIRATNAAVEEELRLTREDEELYGKQ